MGLDYASLFNVETDAAMEKIQAALVGSVKPIRSDSGYDITETTIGTKAAELGITTSVRNLNQMEKRLLRIIVLMDQMRETGAMQDFARTIEQPANQIKVLKNQIKELGTWIGNVFIGTIGKALPYINGFVMALIELVKMLATFVGFTNTGSGLAEGLEIADDTTDSIASGIGSAAASAKELKKTLFGFDVLNNMQTPTESSGGSGSGSSIGEIDPKILGALEDYDNLMSQVRMKASDIKDNIMKWFGYTKKINPLTGEISYDFTGLSKGAKITAIALASIVGLKFIWKVVKLIGKLKNLQTILKTGMPSGLSASVQGINTFVKAFKDTKAWLELGVEQFQLTYKATGNFTEALKTSATGMWNLIPSALKVAGGIGGIAISLYGAYDASRDFSEGTKSVKEYAGQLSVSVAGAAASGALLGSVIPGVGTLAGALVGTLGALAAAAIGYKDEVTLMTEEIEDNIETRQEYLDQLKEEDDYLKELMQTNLTEIDNTKDLVNELSLLVDENGKVKKGYEDRVLYILNQVNEAYGTEYSLVDGRITQNGEYVESVDDVTDSIYDLIEAEQAQMLLDLYSDEWKNSQTEALKLSKEISTMEKQRKNLTKDINKKLKELGLTTDDIKNNTQEYGKVILNADAKTKKLLNSVTKQMDTLDDLDEQLDDVKDQYEKTTKTSIYYENLQEAVVSKDTEKIKKAKSDMVNHLGGVTNDYVAQIEEAIRENEIYRDTLTGTEEEIDEKAKIHLEARLKTIKDNLIEQSQTVDELTPEIVEGWLKLGETSSDALNDALEDLPEDTRKKVQDAMNSFNDTLVKSKIPTEKNSKILRNIVTGILGEDTTLTPKITLKPSVAINTTGASKAIKIFNSAVVEDLENKNNLTRKLEGMNNITYHATKFATGGLPDIGELFVAREAGPELVGKIGNSNAVMNNQQIVEAVSSGVAQAVASVMGGMGGSSYQLYIDGTQITDVIQRRMARNANITGMAMGV